MLLSSRIAVLLVALIHCYIVVLEVFLWTSDYGRKVFQSTPEFAESTVVMAQNQGLYNGFLAAGLFWGLAYKDAHVKQHIQLFFLGCVAVAGVVGALTAKMSILFVQTVPAVIGIVLVLLAARKAD